MKEFKAVTFIFNTIIIIINVHAQQILPPVPCPEIFSYEWDPYNDNYYGQLKVNNQNSQIIDLFVTISVNYNVTDFYGSLELLYSEEQVRADIMHNRSIYYVITFPPHKDIPKLISVVVNDAVLCTGQTESNLDQMANVTLEHTFLSHHGLKISSISSNQSESIQSAMEICGTVGVVEQSLDFSGSIGPTPSGAWPWLAAIYTNRGSTIKFDYQLSCTGTLVSSKIVLSAAHCFQIPVTYGLLIVVLGRHNVNNWDEAASTTHLIKEIRTHNDYASDSNSFDADVAVIILLETVTFTNFIRPACIWPPYVAADAYNIGLVVGWGAKDGTISVSNVPVKVSANIVSDLSCLRSNVAFLNITSHRTFCAGSRDGTGPCIGDSGSGLLVQVDNRWYLRGAVVGSLRNSDKTCNLREYIIYADYTKFLKWIYSHIGTFG